MNIQLFRIDDRLIHGQVVIGWANYLNSKQIILCDDSVADNEWEKELYLTSVPEDLLARVLTVEDLSAELIRGDRDLSKTIIVINGPQVLEDLLSYSVDINPVNVGGIHFREGRHKYLPYIYLDAAEIACFQRMIERGIRFECLDVPDGKPVALEKILPASDN